MICPKCAGSFAGAPPLCPHCGYPILEDDRRVRLAFEGDTFEAFGWMLLLLLSAIVVVPLAWTIAAFCRWFSRNLHFSDGTSAEFTGTGPEVLGWVLLRVLLAIVTAIPRAMGADREIQILLGIADFFIGALISLMILRWAISRIRLSTGPPLHFDGEYPGYLGYQLLAVLAIVTVIGWAWVVAALYRWMALHTRGEGIAVQFHGRGWEILWRGVLAALGSLLIVTIPWMWMWYTRWLVSCITMTRGARTELPAANPA